jgi:hypothetical protein
MPEKPHKFSIIFEQIDKLSKEPGIKLASDEHKEYEEIRALREIALEMQTPEQTYLTST